MTNEIKKMVLAKTLIASMTIFYTIVSAGLCIGSGYIGMQIAKYYEISKWWIVIPMIVVAIALIAYLETMGWYEKFYKLPRRRLQDWADIKETDQ